MKLSALSLPALALVAGLALAQQPADGPPRGGPPRGPSIEMLAKELSLSDSQKAQIQQILDAQRAPRDAQRQQHEASGTRPTREEMEARRSENDAALHQQLGTVLTTEQLAKFDSLRQQRGRPPGPPRGSRDSTAQ